MGRIQQFSAFFSLAVLCVCVNFAMSFKVDDDDDDDDGLV